VPLGDHRRGVVHLVLAVGVEGDDLLHVRVAERVVDTGLQRRALAHVVGVAHHGGPGLRRDPSGVVRAAVIDADDQRVAGAQVTDDVADDLALVEQRDHEPGGVGTR
jgi:hypothetical protein